MNSRAPPREKEGWKWCWYVWQERDCVCVCMCVAACLSQPTRLHSTQVKQQQKAPSPSCHDNPDLSSCSPVPIKTLRPSIISMAREQRERQRERQEKNENRKREKTRKKKKKKQRWSLKRPVAFDSCPVCHYYLPLFLYLHTNLIHNTCTMLSPQTPLSLSLSPPTSKSEGYNRDIIFLNFKQSEDSQHSIKVENEETA